MASITKVGEQCGKWKSGYEDVAVKETGPGTSLLGEFRAASRSGVRKDG
jgi:hypothetical protein